jgi:hypothetical protein
MVKFCVGKANNSGTVKQVLRMRWWFQPLEIEDFEKSQIIWTSWYKKKFSNEVNKINGVKKIYNRMDRNHFLSNKKCLLQSFQEYYEKLGICVFKQKVFPLTFHII